jgi:hypothetical protein
MEKGRNQADYKAFGAIREKYMVKQNSVSHNLECEGDLHTHHLCYMVAQSFHLSDEHHYQTLTKEPKFKCQQCGRVAKSEKNLCQPLRL